jgi:hypothetical protein
MNHHSPSFHEIYTAHNNLRVPTTNAPVPKASAIVASDDNGTSQTISLNQHEKVGRIYFSVEIYALSALVARSTKYDWALINWTFSLIYA